MEMLKSVVEHLRSNLARYTILALILLLALFGFKGCRKVQKRQDSAVKSAVLAPDQREKIVVDPIRHTITVVTKKPDGTDQSTTTFLPDRPTAVIEDNNGKLSIVDHKFGVELRPYLGVGGAFDGTPRVHLGADFLYFHKMDLGAGLDTNPSHLKDVRGNLNLSYNFYSNTSIACSYDNHKTVGLFLKVRF
jgi:hypothetical protein